ncbi:MAG: hypothetical protein ACTIDE_10695 [Carnobacterium maltaromaticum]
MYSELDDFLENESDKSIEEKKNMINEMVDILNFEQLSQVINFLREPFFTNKLKDYLLDSRLPDIESKEFLFLVQAAKYSGNIVRKLMNKADISNYYLDKFIYEYRLQEISSGIYIFPHKSLDAPFLFQSQYSRAVISHESALYMLDLSDVIPRRTIMSMPKDYKFSQLKKNSNRYIKIHDDVYNNNKSLVLSYYENDPIFLTRSAPIGSAQIVTKKTMNNNLVRITSAERTIADILTPNSNTEEEVKYEALKKYYDLYPRDSKRLRRIAHKQGVLKELDKYLWELQLS